MTDEELLRRAANAQSFSPTGSIKRNEYNGLDNLSMGSIQDDRMYALVHDGILKDLEAGNTSGIEYFFDQATYDKYVDPDTGEFDAKALSEALQVKPYRSGEMRSEDGHAEYRTSIVCFDRTGEIRAPVGVCEANTQFGGGGAHEAFIPAEESRALQANGTLRYNSDASNIHTGQNYSIGADEYRKIRASSIERRLNCREKGLQHPEPEACQNGFEPNPDVGGIPFSAIGLQDDSSDKNNRNDINGTENNGNINSDTNGVTEKKNREEDDVDGISNISADGNDGRRDSDDMSNTAVDGSENLNKSEDDEMENTVAESENGSEHETDYIPNTAYGNDEKEDSDDMSNIAVGGTKNLNESEEGGMKNTAVESKNGSEHEAGDMPNTIDGNENADTEEGENSGPDGLDDGPSRE